MLSLQSIKEKKTGTIAGCSLAVATISMIVCGGPVGCGQMRQLAEMHDSTEQMRGYTESMTHQMKGMDEKTQSLHDLTAELYDDSKQGVSLQLREDLLKKMVAANSQPEKLSKAAKYYMSFEYQLWDGAVGDTDARRNQLAGLAVKEFIAEVQSYISIDEMNGIVKIDPSASVEKANQMKPPAGQPTTDYDQTVQDANVNALAATMEYQNRKQEELLSTNPKLKSLSMLSMIEDALSAKASIESGRQSIRSLPSYVKEVLSFEKVALLLEQARMNESNMMALALVSHIRDSAQKLVDMATAPWDLNIDTMNSVEIRDAGNFLKEANRVYAFLSSVGIKPDVNTDIVGLWANAKNTKEMEDIKKRGTVDVARAPKNPREAVIADFMIQLANLQRAALAPADTATQPPPASTAPAAPATPPPSPIQR